jgi:poly-gamma-glutamate synthesis protein (capsule biosynthesis protein)
VEKLISSLLAFLLTLVPSVSQKPIDLPNNEVEIIFAGDTMLGRSVMGASLDNNDPLYPFRHTKDVIKDADITFLNLENPIIKNCERHVGGFKFCTTYEIANGLSFAGVDVVTLANNHSENYGKEGLEETIKYLNEIGIKSVGYDNLEIIEKNGVKFGFLGFNYTFSNQSLENDLKLILDSDLKADVLIVGVHWGEEYKETANNFQRVTAKKMVESGADALMGHHPHWVQNYEEINRKPVYYSLGNFVFDQMWSEETKKGLIVKMTFKDSNLIKKEEFKTYIRNIGQPEIWQ